VGHRRGWRQEQEGQSARRSHRPLPNNRSQRTALRAAAEPECQASPQTFGHSYIRAYIASVRFTWDPGNSERKFAARPFDFAFAASIFEGPTLERIDTRQDFGEVRRIALGIADGIPITVVYTDRVEAGDVLRRIISA